MKKALFAISLLCAAQLSAQSFSNVKSITQGELTSALAEYSDLQKSIADEKVPLSKELDGLEQDTYKLREEFLANQRAQSTIDSSLIEMKATVDSLADTNTYIANLLNDYIIRWESMIQMGEREEYAETTDAAKAAKEDASMSEGEKFEKQLAVLQIALNRSKEIIGGKKFTGVALVGKEQQEEEGNFALVGPICFFSSTQSEHVGWAMTEFNANFASVEEELGAKADFASIRELTVSGTGVAPIDGTLGQAIDIEKNTDSVADEIAKGGMVMYPIVGLLAISILIIIFKLLALAGVKKVNQKDLASVLEAIKEDDGEKALAIAKKTSGPAGELLVAAVEHAEEDKEVIEEVLYEVIINNQPKLESMLAFIAVTAATAPLLGLLGTVTGMIKTFKMITVFGTGDASNLADGIGEALLTTKWGLVVAIPTVLSHALLSRMARGVIGSMEQTAVSFINGIVEIRNESNS